MERFPPVSESPASSLDSRRGFLNGGTLAICLFRDCPLCYNPKLWKPTAKSLSGEDCVLHEMQSQPNVGDSLLVCSSEGREAEPAAARAAGVSATIGYYDEHAREFAADTVGVEFSAMQEKFASMLPPGASVLDFGCGSGRDARSFLERGFHVAATDGSAELCRIASRLTGLDVRNELFQDLADISEYDGIWACSSILHLPKEELADVLTKMLAALRPGGIIYTSFKYGTFEGVRNGRYFTDFTVATFCDFIRAIGGAGADAGATPRIEVIECWTSGDVRPGRGDEKWLNLLLGKS